MSHIFDIRSRNLGKRYHGLGSTAPGPINVSPLAAISTSVALTPSLGRNLSVSAAIASSVGLSPSASTGGGGSSAVVQSAQFYPGTSGAFGSSNTAGNLIFCIAIWNDTTGTSDPTISDTLGQTWTATTIHRAVVGAQTSTKMFYKANCGAGANTPALGTLGAGSDYGIIIGEISGIKTSPTVASNYADFVANATPSLSLTTAVKSCLICFLGDENAAQGTITAGSGFTMVQKDESHAHAVEFESAVAAGSNSGSFNCSLGLSGSIGVFSFEEA